MIHVASQAGYMAIDIPMCEASEFGVDETIEQLHAAQLRPGAAKLPVEFRKDANTYQEGLRGLPEAARSASQIGVNTLCRALPASSETPKDELYPLLRKRIRECAFILDSYGLRLGLEFLGFPGLRRGFRYEFIWTLNEALQYAASCGSNVGILLDSWHWFYSGGTTEDIVNAGSRIAHVEISDAPAIPANEVRDDQRLLPGRGIIDLKSFLQAVTDTGYGGLITPEVLGYRSSLSCVEAALVARTAAESVLPQGPFNKLPVVIKCLESLYFCLRVV